jgi:hypothetical protein
MVKCRGRPRKRLTREDLSHAARILNFDVARGGELLRVECPRHGSSALAYLYCKGIGVRVYCEIGNCRWETVRRESTWKH